VVATGDDRVSHHWLTGLAWFARRHDVGTEVQIHDELIGDIISKVLARLCGDRHQVKVVDKMDFIELGHATSR
jgi:hypothetical protein